MKKRQKWQRAGGPHYEALISAAVVAALGLPTMTWAQTADATLRGQAAASVEIVAVNVTTGATRRTTSGADGVYELIGLPAGTYRVTAGGGTPIAVTLNVATTATLDLTQPGAAAVTAGETLEEVIVRAVRPTEVKTSEVGTIVSLHEIQTVPQLTRNFLEFADTVPGMIFSVDNSGNTSLSSGAQANSAVNVYIDGVGQKNYILAGGLSGQFFSQGNPFPQLAIGEYKVITSNYGAQYDQIGSAAITAETKSGTNEFHGEVFGTYTNQDLRAWTPAELAADKKTDSNDLETGFAIGGPIISNVLHFFATMEYKKFDTPVTVVPGVLNVTNLLPANVASQFGPSGLPFTEKLYFAKIDFEPNDTDRFELSSKVRDEGLIQNIGTAEAASSAIDTINNDVRIDLRWQHSADHWNNNLLLTYENAYNAPSAVGSGNGSIYTYDLAPGNYPTIVDTGPASPLATQNKGQAGPSVQDDFTLAKMQWHGEHTLMAGFKYKAVSLKAQDAGEGNPQFYYDVEPVTGTLSVPYKAFFSDPVPGESPIVNSSDQQYGLYFQDDWAPTHQLLLNLGVRWDYEVNPSYLHYVTPANVVAALNSPDTENGATGTQTYAQALAAGGVNVNDYISTGSNRKPYAGEIQPRLGFSYDINDDQTHVVFGGAGRQYDRDLYEYLQLEQTKSALPEFTEYFNNGTGYFPNSATNGCINNSAPCVAWNPSFLNGVSNLQALVGASNAGAEVDAINNNLKPPHTDVFSLGMRNKLGDWNTSATLSRQLSYDGFAFTLGNRYPGGAFWMGGSQPWCCGVPGFGNYIIGNNGIDIKATQVLLSAEKPYTELSGWGATIAYTFTSAVQNRDITQFYAFDEANIGAYPFIASNAAPKHRLVATASAKIPWNMIFAAKLTLATPVPVDDIGCNFSGAPLFGGSYCEPIAMTPKGLLGFKDVDFEVTKNFDLGNDRTLYVRADVLNFFNFRNFINTANSWNPPNGPNSVTYVTNGNIQYVPEEFRLTAGFKF